MSGLKGSRRSKGGTEQYQWFGCPALILCIPCALQSKLQSRTTCKRTDEDRVECQEPVPLRCLQPDP